ncbi:hypothetical protein [Streptococcus ovuberis]|uniref:DUF308 domain-containing protein n=1 Tax=Streptococcus ovuberis TaxID=1936207 RepID=A0A7X6MXT1_9STRE|nr:hypothetical protein [Streptococcus ovuberis]NKZ19733.1 hypothetical protein [Streptococcus ovuberis]
MPTKKWTSRIYYMTGLVLMGLGLGFLHFQTRFSMVIFQMAGLLILGQGVLAGLRLLGQKASWSLGRLLLHLGIGLLFLSTPLLPAGLLGLAIGLYQGILGTFLLIHSGLAFANGLPGRYLALIDGLVHVVFAGLVLFYAQDYLPTLYWFLGLYLLFLGLTNLRDGVEFDLGKVSLKVRRKRIGLPIILTGFIPVSALNKVNSYLNKERSQALFLGDKTQAPDLEIWIHTARRGFEMMGHVDLVFDGISYSYGNHDVDSTKLFEAVGDGVLMTMPAENYQASLKADDWRAVFGYGLVLTPEEKAKVKANLTQLLSEAQPFALKSDKQKASYLGGMVAHYGARAYKFRQGTFKTYFVMTTNCVQLVDRVVADAGLDIVTNSGILTPGAYQAYLDKEFANPHSRVVSKMVLGRQTP